jgi:membrane-bound lytic murein transglycosylase A
MKILIFIFIISSCARIKLPPKYESMRLVSKKVLLTDDMPLEDFKSGLAINVKLLMRKPNKILQFGKRNISSRDYALALNILTKFKDKKKLLAYIQKNFITLEVYGKNKWGEILLTSYYEPLYSARLKPTDKYYQAIYKLPSDLVELDLQKLANKELRAIETSRSIMGGRVKAGPGVVPRIVPYFNREEIDNHNSLKGQKLELYYLDPIHAFFLQIQGSGILELKDGTTVRVGYVAQNGWKYESIGKHLFDVIPKEEMSLQRIEQHLRTLNKRELYEFLKINPSYVFFRILKGRGLTTFGNEVISGRTLAVDNSYVPLGALGFLNFKKPYYKNMHDSTATSFNKTSRLILAQDTGGAIKSPGRADLYWGEGDKALKYAGMMKHDAKLWFLFPKKHNKQKN